MPRQIFLKLSNNRRPLHTQFYPTKQKLKIGKLKIYKHPDGSNFETSNFNFTSDTKFNMHCTLITSSQPNFGSFQFGENERSGGGG